MSIIKMIDLNLYNKKILIRADLNVPIENGKIINDARIKAFLPTIEIALKKGAKIIISSHLGQPIEGEYNEKFSLKPIVNYLSHKINYPINLVNNYLNGIEVNNKEIIVLENVRFNKGEKKDDQILSKKYAELCDIYVMDAFGTAHRTQASTHGVIKFAPIACAGPLLSSELDALSQALKKPTHPMVAIVGGSKISTKLTILNSLSKIADYIIVGGGIANTFIAAKGYKIGNSLYEKNLIPEAKKLLSICNIYIPIDVCVATEFSKTATSITKRIDDIKNNEQILDLGKETIKHLVNIIKKSKTILWNGPIGVFEFYNFSYGTKIISQAIAESDAFSIAGGGDTLSAIDLFGIKNKISYTSTGGGAFLKFLEGKKLPSVIMLEKRAK
ncbi:MAG: phosphoglycerate kinase [Arsenophonus endosymbiont of Ceratovacuna japonica]